MQTVFSGSNGWRCLCRLVFDVVLVGVLGGAFAVCELAIEPHRRGFFCNDTDISYPLRANTVSKEALILLVLFLPAVVFASVEFFVSGRVVASGNAVVQPMLALVGAQRSWLGPFVRQFFYYFVGLALILDAVQLGKYSSGRLRPHFMAACEPRLLDGTTCRDAANWGRYIEDYACDGDASVVRQSRLSFPSGHAGSIFYTMVYLVLYLQRYLLWRSVSHLAKPTLQWLLLAVAVFTAISRVMDHWHHSTDVLAGCLLGTCSAAFTAVYVAQWYDRRATTTAPQDTHPTPPPYFLDTSCPFNRT